MAAGSHQFVMADVVTVGAVPPPPPPYSSMPVGAVPGDATMAGGRPGGGAGQTLLQRKAEKKREKKEMKKQAKLEKAQVQQHKKGRGSKKS